VKEGKLGLRARKCIFLDHTSKMKVYWVWCVDSKLLKFITSSNMIFDKSIIFHKEKKSTYFDVEMDQGTNKQVELEIRASKTMYKDALTDHIKEVVHDIVDKNTHEEKHYRIAIKRQGR
jgi:hypothetical protein